MKTPSTLLKVLGLEVSINKRQILDIHSLEIENNQIVLLTGANGSGKTTVLKYLSGLIKAQRGQVEYLGQPMSLKAATRFFRGRHIYLHQTPLMFDGSVSDNVAFGLRCRATDDSHIAIDVRNSLEWAHLDHLASRNASELSTGEKQRVALIRAKILNPKVLLLDEITSNMDLQSRTQTLNMLEDMKQTNCTVVFATHDIDIIERFGTNSLLISRGAIPSKKKQQDSVVSLQTKKTK